MFIFVDNLMTVSIFNGMIILSEVMTSVKNCDKAVNCQLVKIGCLQYIPRNMHTVFALLCFVVVIHWLIFTYPSGLLHWHCGNLTIAPVPAKQPWWIWINTSCEFIMNDCITTTKHSTTKPCAYFLGYTVYYTGQTTIHCPISRQKSLTPFILLEVIPHIRHIFNLMQFLQNTFYILINIY